MVLSVHAECQTVRHNHLFISVTQTSRVPTNLDIKEIREKSGIFFEKQSKSGINENVFQIPKKMLKSRVLFPYFAKGWKLYLLFCWRIAVKENIVIQRKVGRGKWKLKKNGHPAEE